jgi:hypothetical protein
MASILLGVARLDALNSNTESQPPHGQTTEAEKKTMRAGEWHTFVFANTCRQAVLLENPLKYRESPVFFDRLQSLAAQQVALQRI